MSRPLHALIVEDSDDDVLLLVRNLSRGGFDPDYRQVSTAQGLTKALAEQAWDVILCDYGLPKFSGAAALGMVRKSGADTPFIFVSGMIGEEMTATLMKAGAHDVILKDNLARLVPAIERELLDAAGRRERRQALDALRLSEERYALAMRGANDGFWDWDIEVGKLYLSPRMGEIFDIALDSDADHRKMIFSYIHPDDAEHYRKTAIAHLKGETDFFMCEFRVLGRSNGARWALSRGLALRHPGGRAYRMAGSTTDITELKLREKELADKTRHLEAALENMDQGISMVDGDLNVAAFNPRFLELLGFPADLFGPHTRFEDVIRFNAERGEYGIGDVETLVAERVERAKRFIPHHFERVRPDGVVLDIRGRPMPGGGFVTTYSDITERKRAEEALRESEEKFRSIFDNAAAGIALTDVEGRFLDTNASFRALFGYSDDELRGLTFRDLIHPDDRAESRRAFLEVMAGKRQNAQLTMRYIRKDGNVMWGRVVVTQMRQAATGDPVAISMVEDITEQKKAEEALRQAHEELELRVEERTRQLAAEVEERKTTEHALRRSEERLNDAIESLPDGFLIYDKDDRLVVYNKKSLDLYPKAADAIAVGATFEEITRKMIERKQFADFGMPIEEWMKRRLETHRNPTDAHLQQLDDGRWILVSERRTKDGGIVSVRTDITDLRRAEAELRAAKEWAELANRAKSEFLSSMSHELRTPLNAVLGITEILQEDAHGMGLERFGEPLQRIANAGRHLLSLINDILDLSKIEAGMMTLHPEAFDLASMITDTVATVEQLANVNRNRLEVRCPSDIGMLTADLTRVRQIVFNLLSNACKFTEGGAITIKISRPRRNGKEWVKVAVSDTGIGIAADDLDRIFEPFSQADSSITRRYEGTGLGLAICRRFSQMMGGKIKVRSAPGKGSTFTLQLPERPPGSIAAPERRPVAAGETRPKPPQNDAKPTILYVEDNEDNVYMLSERLQRLGFTVIVAGDGDEGIAKARAQSPSVILMDLRLPVLDGWEATRRLKSMPETQSIPVIAISAHAMEGDREKAIAAGCDDYDTKPVNIGRLIKKIEALTQRGVQP